VTLGIAGQDDISGHLTSNLGVVRSENGRCELVVNVRYPVTWELEALQNRLQDGIAGTGVTLVKTDWQGPLYVPQDDPLIETLLAVYREQTGDGAEPRAIGGGTYARAMRKGVAFGPTFGNREGGAHQADEHWPVADLIAATRIFARAIYRLATQ
jgi:succinyl-diaminopimelate desuccinylase